MNILQYVVAYRLSKLHVLVCHTSIVLSIVKASIPTDAKAKIFKTRIQIVLIVGFISALKQRWQTASRSRRRSMTWKGPLTIFFRIQKILMTMTKRQEQSRSTCWFYPSKPVIGLSLTRQSSCSNQTAMERRRGTMKIECKHCIHL